MNVYKPAKSIILTALMLALGITLIAADRQIDVSKNNNQARLSNNGDLGFDVHYAVGDIAIREVQTSQGPYDEVYLEGWGFTNDVGEPKLPMMRRIISVPLGAEVRHTITSQVTREFDPETSQLKNQIIPAQEPVSKSADPEDIPFLISDAAYSSRGFNDRDWIRIEELGIMRGVRLFCAGFFSRAL